MEKFISLDTHTKKENHLKIYMDKIIITEKSVLENGFYSEDEVEE